jgi:hypothetical protein
MLASGLLCVAIAIFFVIVPRCQTSDPWDLAIQIFLPLVSLATGLFYIWAYRRSDPKFVLTRRAEKFLRASSWCRGVRRARMVWAPSESLGVVAADITSSRPGLPTSFWVIVGDVPVSAFPRALASDGRQALRLYTDELQRWVEAACAGLFVQGTIPLAMPATPENAVRVQRVIDDIRWSYLSDSAPGLQ